MSTYALRHVPDGLIAQAKQRARDEHTTLDAVLIRFLTSYAAHGHQQTAGGKARAESMTPEQRLASSQHATRTRQDRLRALREAAGGPSPDQDPDSR